ncbi:alpha/beta hydrolase [Pseudonocardia sp. GCM10023141]|uniref:alpha/beta hydrolase n=1 Tax=Pseudonocardia sp. GCM10023141 TaxID=3252653 RepID=UPI00361DF13F
MHLPLAVVSAMTRGVISPLLDSPLPRRLRRRLLDVTGYSVPSPRGTRRAPGELGGVATELVAAPGVPGPHVVLYLHGGGYEVGSPTSHRALIARLSRAAGAHVYAPAYRLAPEHPFPAGSADVLAAYRALRAAGHDAQRIAVAGDSAGGGLAMTLLLQLRAAGEELPGSVGLISPWLDFSHRSPTLALNAGSDAMLSPEMLVRAADAYSVGSDAPELRSLDADLSGLPPLHVIAGAAEILLGDSDTLVERVEAAGGAVTYRREPRMWHAFPVFVGMLREADEAVEELGAQLRADCAGV